MTDDMLEAFRETLINTLRFDEDYKKKGNVLNRGAIRKHEKTQ